MLRTFCKKTGIGLALFLFSALATADSLVQKFTLSSVNLSNPCAVFNDPASPTVMRILYGENIPFNLAGTIQSITSTDGSGVAKLKFQIVVHGDGIGARSFIKYQFHAKSLVTASSNPDTSFSGRFKLDARIIGQGNTVSPGLVAQGAQDNAVLHFDADVTFAPGSNPSMPLISISLANFSAECSASPWSSQMNAPNAATKQPVGRGFGDVWNKYAWSMKDFGGKVVVGTKNAYFDYLAIAAAATNPGSPINLCLSSPALGQIPSLYRTLACAELVESGISNVPSGLAQTRFAEIWRFDYTRNNWAKSRDEASAGTYGQGFRILQTHAGKLYAGSDLGSFIMGIKLGSWNGAGTWDFPGSRVLVSPDGINFTQMANCSPSATQPNPCNAGSNSTPDLPFTPVNISFRALASFSGKLYLGTFNFTGGELWSYDAAVTSGSPWAPVAKFQVAAHPICSGPLWSGKCTGVFSAGVTELLTWSGTQPATLVIGVAAPAIDRYLWTYNGTSISEFAGIPTTGTGLNNTTLGVLKLFSTSLGELYVGLLDLTNGFTLISCKPADCNSGSWNTVTSNGFGNVDNAYAWSMAQVNGRTFVGTFNKNFFAQLPRGSSELWSTADGLNWQQQALPLSWGLWNYGIRTMETANKQLFLGTASNIVAPDLTLNTDGTPLSPGAEIWTIRSNVVAPKR